jgi:hypothetical protein
MSHYARVLSIYCRVTTVRLFNSFYHDGMRLWRSCVSFVSRLRLQCIHQLDLVMKRVFHNLLDNKFVSMLTGVMTGHWRRQQNLISEMKSACPTFVETR